MNEQTLQIRNGRLVDPANGVDARLDLFIVGGHIAAIGQPPPGFTAQRIIDAGGLIVCPGLVDLSARLGAIEPELLAAVAGGVTSLACPPDSKPPLDEPGLVERLVRRTETLGLARVYPIGALTEQLAGERLAEMNGLARAGCIAFSQAKRAVADTQILLRAMQYAATFGYAVRLRPQDDFLARDGVAHDGEVASRLGLTGIPVVAESIATATALQLAAHTGVRLHLSRISSAAAIGLVRAARDAGMAVSCDVAVHHLHLSEMDIGFFDSNARFDPPLRSASDRDALRSAVADGLAAICSDHTPIDADGKQLPFAEALPGATALELLLPLTLLWAAQSRLPLLSALARITSDAAAILGVAAGSLGVGDAADLCIFDPDESWRVTPEALRSQGKHTPYLGYELSGRVHLTLVGGRVVFEG
ncbi:MAG: Dihydroorotase [Candidatus Accumulibacter sp. BA-94]|uniref:dihydroorotase n=1 Tax=Accumulibacter sp. TaxID=2053492 RepID=UPI0004479C00|nr:dihydroorotase [Accumulibacter sp.]EXI92443.1 MAG: Dihydroorotase [Candidatus Accumulibacter sp. BA-94]MBL8390318.1 dihydroorotase [Accumulibacter sp.]HRD87484.1 dihydroorotase [Accumulibacter sp.]